ncbi:MAG TPA: DEAD/DEAH box helicase [Woeseiaceae bacterium]|nr:DEAD/DEAH box helicase [Woeseiaceae bacterium]
MSFQSLGLSAELCRAVSEQNYDIPTPIQRQAIPLVLEGRDLLAVAQTGTGKTAGFALPLMQRLCRNERAPGARPVRTLILTPTRELAAQVEQSVIAFGKYLPLKSAVIYGGVSIRPQIAELRRGVDIVVATPGRLLDHASQRTIDLSRVEILVLDEADRMLDMGFIRDIRKIIALLPKTRQNLLFSATFNKETMDLADRLLQTPAKIEVAGAHRTADTIAQRIYPVDRARKRELLSWLIGSENWRQVLVFTRTKHAANRLATQLDKDGLATTAIHGNKSQGARSRALRDFKNGHVRVLVATDIAARGLDIDQLPHVVNFDLPQVAEDYVHRVGRTGRAGLEGEAVSLVCAEERPLLAAVEKLLGRSIERTVVPGFEANHGASARPMPTGRTSRATPPAPSRSPKGGHEPRRPSGDRSRKRRRDNKNRKAVSYT